MTGAQFQVFLELLAQLVEAKAHTGSDAAELIRQAKGEVEWWSIFKNNQQ